MPYKIVLCVKFEFHVVKLKSYSTTIIRKKNLVEALKELTNTSSNEVVEYKSFVNQDLNTVRDIHKDFSRIVVEGDSIKFVWHQ